MFKLVFLALLFLVPNLASAQNWFNSSMVNKCSTVRKNCQEHLSAGCTKTGYYQIFINNTPTKVQCEQELAGGGWIVFQRRESFFDFYRPRATYVTGFGDGANNFWLGLETLYQITNGGKQMAVYLEKGNGVKGIAYYSNFKLNNAASGYYLTSVGSYSYETASGYTNPGDSFSGQAGNQFSSYDAGPSSNCGVSYKGGWWYGGCHSSNLNGYYYYSSSNTSGYHASYADGLDWYTFYGYGSNDDGYHYSLKKTIMMVK